jgi:hypothetical protein
MTAEPEILMDNDKNAPLRVLGLESSTVTVEGARLRMQVALPDGTTSALDLVIDLQALGLLQTAAMDMRVECERLGMPKGQVMIEEVQYFEIGESDFYRGHVLFAINQNSIKERRFCLRDDGAKQFSTQMAMNIVRRQPRILRPGPSDIRQ